MAHWKSFLICVFWAVWSSPSFGSPCGFLVVREPNRVPASISELNLLIQQAQLKRFGESLDEGALVEWLSTSIARSFNEFARLKRHFQEPGFAYRRWNDKWVPENSEIYVNHAKIPTDFPLVHVFCLATSEVFDETCHEALSQFVSFYEKERFYLEGFLASINHLQQVYGNYLLQFFGHQLQEKNAADSVANQ